MPTLITGVTGYLGRALVNEYINTDKKVILTYRERKLDIKNKNFFWKKFDLYSSHNKYDYFEKPISLIHLAWDGLHLRNYDSDIHFQQLDYHFNFIENLLKGGLKNITILGSCFEYGDHEGELHEEILSQPKTQYGKAKNILRIKLETLKSKYSFNLTWIRVFYLYGGSVHKNDLWGSINKAVKLKSKIFFITDGSQLRDYLHIYQVSKYIKQLSVIKKDLGIVNVCSNKPISIKNLVNDWIKKYNWNVNLELKKTLVENYVNKNFWGSDKKLNSIIKKYNNI